MQIDDHAPFAQRIFVALPPVQLDSLFSDVVTPIASILGAQVVTWQFSEEERGVWLALERRPIADDAVPSPSLACFSVVQMRRCLSALNEIALFGDFLVVDFVLDLLDGHVLAESSSEVVLQELSWKANMWVASSNKRQGLWPAFLAIVPAMGMGISVFAGQNARHVVLTAQLQDSLERWLACPFLAGYEQH
eukprot:5800941-Amphidinium_carterae.1